MIDIASIVALCQSALAGGTKVFEAYQKKKLSDEERELLVCASQTGEFFLHTVAQLPGTWVKAGRKHFQNESDPAYAATYLEAFRSLCERGLIIHEGGKLFMLTGTGFKKARELAMEET